MPRLRQGVEAAVEWGRRVIPTGWEEAWGRSRSGTREAQGTTGWWWGHRQDGQEQASSAGGGTYRPRGAMG